MRQIVLDTETTGLSAEGGDRIIEIGCVELVYRKLTGNNRHFYLNPERDSHEDALKVHGISNEFLRDKPKFAAVADELLEYLAGAEIIIHNAPFDVGFPEQGAGTDRPAAFTDFVGSVIDTLMMAKEMFPANATGWTRCATAWAWTTRPHLARRVARCRIAGRCLHQPHARAGCAADRHGGVRQRWATSRLGSTCGIHAAGIARQRAGSRGARRDAQSNWTRRAAARRCGGWSAAGHVA